ncbi:penicillin-binding protein 1A [Psychrobacter sp. AOP22-C1-22]|uniref:penicillin-binding protein 1A n=1 Tax=unclassified Psychrobacter TaxID=196806 RepID=UPI0017880C19|nr:MULTISPECIES: PBP1A family penicillin-binding protein [unclassified Psychrobacter]MBE0407947.1 PBP1A family penicillin-binding protein [Psychrobacter sp. FME6]MBE0445434.1 PBP1A family penicillin-binding protein [Psychrobacter sp. FME5]MDN5891866.1 PBP1A family penicillin-binding protein [Psychrobacter sp.]
MAKKNATVRLIHFLVSLFIACLALAVVLALAVPIGFYGMAMYLSPTLPSTQEIKTAKLEMPLQIYSSDDKLIGQYGNRLSLPITFEDIPEDLTHAFLAAEDASFFQHSGISIKGLGRAVTEVVTDDDSQTGGSTITMQVAKNYFLSPERTLNRKLTELFLARKIEDELSKNDILTLYVNKIYLGEGAYGIRAAAKKYYSKSLENLTIAEMAMLAGLPKAPSKYNPVANPSRALTRRNWIIGRMHELGYITQTQHDEAVNSPIGINLYKEKLDVNMPYLAEMTRSTLVGRYGEQVMHGGWRVRLTVDSKAQTDAEAAILTGLVAYEHRHGWRGAEANDEPLEDFRRYSNMSPAKVIKVNNRSFEATMPSGENITVNWSGMSWARKYISADRIGYFPSNASQIVSKNDIIRVIPTANGNWQLGQIPKVQGSLVSLNPETGAVNALVGGFDFNHSKFNRALQGWRQPGSTIKPLIYTAALEKGYRPDSIVSDRPIQVGDWKPKNSDQRFLGDITLRRGLYLSRNLVSIRLLRAIGISDARNLLDEFGLDKEKLPTTLSLALGAGQATPLQMATAYATFANGGHRVQPYFIEQIYNYKNELLFQANPRQACALCFNEQLEDLNKKLVEDYDARIEAENSTNTDKATTKNKDSENAETTEEDIEASNVSVYDASPQSDRLKAPAVQYAMAEQAPRILKPRVAFEMADILRDVVQRGTAVRAKALGRNDIGGKTGTTNEAKDAWFAGFHPTNATIVWMGFDQPSTLGRREYGGVAALPVWMDFMKAQLKGVPNQWVSINNRSKSQKQKQKIINMTDDGIVTSDDEDTDSSTSVKPVKTQTQQRKPEAPEPVEDSSTPQATNATNSQNNNDSVPQNPLSVTPVERMPPLPE